MIDADMLNEDANSQLSLPLSLLDFLHARADYLVILQSHSLWTVVI